MLRIPALLLIVLLAGTGIDAAAQVGLRQESVLRIEGTSTVNSFVCETKDLEGRGQVEAADVAGRLAVSVTSFDCGNERINRDFHAAMQASAHPEIRFELDDADVVAAPTSANAPYRLRASGRLTIAGQERDVTVDLTGWTAPDGTLRARGEHALRMTDFGIKPPTALLGLVRTHDRIVVHFELVANDGGALAKSQ